MLYLIPFKSLLPFVVKKKKKKKKRKKEKRKKKREFITIQSHSFMLNILYALNIIRL